MANVLMCDKCGKIFPIRREENGMREGVPDNRNKMYVFDKDNKQKCLDLCDKCRNEFLASMCSEVKQ